PGVLGDGEQPRPDVPPAVEPVHRSQGPGKGLLGDLLRQVFVLGECPDIAVDVPEVQPVDGLKVQGPPPLSLNQRTAGPKRYRSPAENSAGDLVLPVFASAGIRPPGTGPGPGAVRSGRYR